MPKCGLTMREGTVVRWVRKEGDAVEEGDPLVEIETEKANMEVVAPSAGVVGRLVAEVGAVIAVGEVLAILEGSDSGVVHTSVPASATPGHRDSLVHVSDSNEALGEKEQRDDREGRASPLARRVARELGVDVNKIRGTGPRGLVTEANVRAAAATQGAEVTAGALVPVRTQKLTRMRKAIAAALSRSIAEAAQLTVMREVGIAGASAVREGAPDHATMTDVILGAVARVLTRHPRLNAHLIGDELRFFDTVNIGIAVALDEGLVTPVIRDVSGLSLAQIVRQRRQLVDKARSGTLRQSDIQGGTFTITNLGAYGIDTFTPILNPPEVAILGIGAAKPRPSISGGAAAMRQTCPLSLTFDHRALDGAPAALFLADLADLLDDPGRLQEELH